MRAIDADVLKRHIDKLPALPDGNFAGNHSALKALINMQPTIEPSTNNSEIPNSSDCISRQAAIEAVNAHYDDEYFNFYTVMDILKQLPSAQPEIIHCKECKYGVQDEDKRWYCRGLGCQVGEADGSGFCADAERRAKDEDTL